ncbi:hypothetical protein EVAR_13521_1 [Eumeta japonica]|uniref:Uncharacterized protein n=1 Tax=Eumeta variegata TaxID=151549 RepID=A0A4C1U8Q5_EUMVA|nr:hypothetical protein EVAR_13521_1 [Eumeta japonica]
MTDHYATIVLEHKKTVTYGWYPNKSLPLVLDKVVSPHARASPHGLPHSHLDPETSSLISVPWELITPFGTNTVTSTTDGLTLTPSHKAADVSSIVRDCSNVGNVKTYKQFTQEDLCISESEITPEKSAYDEMLPKHDPQFLTPIRRWEKRVGFVTPLRWVNVTSILLYHLPGVVGCADAEPDLREGSRFWDVRNASQFLNDEGRGRISPRKLPSTLISTGMRGNG